MHKISNFVEIRGACLSDHNFVFDSWRRSFADSDFSKPINALVFFKGHHRVIEKILEKGQVEIACSKEFPEEIRGWIAYDRDCLHFIYVKSPFRRFGVSRLLMNGHNFKEYSHLNDNVKYILPGATYNPYTFFMNL